MKKLTLALALVGMPIICARSHPIALYLDLMKRCLTNYIYKNDPGMKHNAVESSYSDYKRERGLDWPACAHTMIGLKRLNNLQFCAEDVLRNRIPGDFIETGVWRGGATIFMRAILRAYNDRTRTVWVADSFAGLPAPSPDKYPADTGVRFDVFPELAVSLESVKQNFERYDLLDDQVKFLKGWFKDTLPGAPIDKLALMRLDGDLYESTMDALVNLYPKLSVGGYVIIDDYTMEFCKKAVTDYREKHGITDPLIWVDHLAVYWKKTQ